MNEEIIITKSAEETKSLGEKLGNELKQRVFCLYGDLGTGKTTFTQGFAKGLGIKARIISPTFMILRNHELKKGNFCHIDLYRVSSKKEVEEIGFTELVEDRENIFIIEWAEKLGSLTPGKRIDIFFETVSEVERKIKIVENG